MYIERIDNLGIIQYLKNYSSSLGKRVDKHIYKTIKSNFDELTNDVKADGFHIICKDKEIDDLVYECVSVLSKERNLSVLCMVGLETTIGAIDKIKNLDSFVDNLRILPSKSANIEFFITEYLDETLDIDYATKLLD